MHLGAVLAGLTGQRAGPSGARGLEFSDYRPYSPGDELRRVDWNIYARLGEAFVKTAPSEAHVGISLLIDGSGSMDGGPPGRPSKFRYAQRLAAMLGAVALLRSDAVAVHVLADGDAWFGGTLNAPQSVLPLVEELADPRRGVGTDLAASVNAYRRGADANVHADVVVLISDALVDSENLRETLRELAGAAGTATLLHIVDDAEAELDVHGPVELRDRETGERMLVELTPAVRAQYATRVEDIARQARELASANKVAYVRALTSVPPLDLLFAAARRAELVAL